MTKIRTLVSGAISIEWIAHLGDIHIRNNERHDEYQRVFTSLYQSLNENKVDLICITGDIIHTKTNISPEVIHYTSDLLLNLESIAPVVVIRGNHDVSLSNPNRMDILDTINRIVKFKQVFLLKKTGVYRIGNIDIYYNSIYSQDTKIFDKILDSNQKNIVLFHGALNNSKNEYGYVFNSTIDSSIFDKFDIVMLGDIHKRQSINSNKIQYCGSLIQQNFGEEIDKGYLIWNVTNQQSKFIKISNDNSFYTITTVNGKLPENLVITDKNPRIRLFLDRYALKNANEITKYLNTITNPIEITTHIKDEVDKNIVTGEYSIQSYYDIQIQNKLISNFLKEKYINITDDELMQVCQLNQDIENQLKDSGSYVMPNYGAVWNINELQFDNMFLYGEDNVIDFDKLHGVTGIFGNNDIGKSALFDTLLFSLWGQTGKSLVLEQIVNDRKRYARTYVTITVSNKKYVIERIIETKPSRIGFERKVVSSILNLYEVRDGQLININEDDKNKTERKIKNLIGDIEDFTSTCMMLQHDETPFIRNKDTKRKNTLINLLGLEPLEQKYERANSLMRDIQAVIKELRSRNYQGELSQIITKMKSAETRKQSIEQEISIIKKELETIDNDIESLQNLIVNITDNVTDIEELYCNLNKLNNDFAIKNKHRTETYSLYEKMKLQLDALTEECKQHDIRALQADNAYYNELLNRQKIVDKEIDRLKFIVQRKLQSLDILKVEPWHETEELCKKCSFMVGAFQDKRELETHAKEAEEYIKQKNELTEQIAVIKNRAELYTTINNKILQSNQLRNDIKLVAMKISEIDHEIKLIETQIQVVDDQIKTYNRNKNSIEQNKIVNTKIKQLKEQQNQANHKLDKMMTQLTDTMGDLKSLESRKNNIIEELNRIQKLEGDYNIYRYYVESIHRDNIPYQIITQIVPHINHNIAHILETTVDFSIDIRDKKDKIEIIVKYPNGDERPIEATGGMVNIISGIAIRASLNQVSVLPKCNILAIDEGFSAFDDNVISSISNFIEFLKSKFKNILMITHINSLKDIADNIIDIKRIGNTSKIIV